MLAKSRLRSVNDLLFMRVRMVSAWYGKTQTNLDPAYFKESIDHQEKERLNARSKLRRNGDQGVSPEKEV